MRRLVGTSAVRTNPLSPRMPGRRSLAIALVMSSLLGVTSAMSCGEDISLGDPAGASSAASVGSSGQGGADVADCTDQSCGTVCLLEGQVGYCDDFGACQPVYTCQTFQPCAGHACGDPCSPCDPAAGMDCPPPEPQPFACDLFGQCLPEPVDCGPCKTDDPDCIYDSCLELGLPCGTPCTICHPDDPGCEEPGDMICDAFLRCAFPEEVTCDPCIAPGTFEPKACGEPCSYCEANPWQPCDGEQFLYVCDYFGFCNPPEIADYCPPEWEPCADKGCGEPCSVCSPDLGCPELPLTCGVDGICSQFFSCEWDPCPGNLECGTPCSPCHPNDFGCQIDGAWFCDGASTCMPAGSVVCPPSYQPCAGKACGELCSICDPFAGPCPDQGVFLACWDDQLCWDVPPPCGWVPCIGRSCGEPCSPCDPMDPGCTEPPDSKLCDASGACVDSPGNCP